MPNSNLTTTKKDEGGTSTERVKAHLERQSDLGKKTSSLTLKNSTWDRIDQMVKAKGLIGRAIFIEQMFDAHPELLRNSMDKET